MLRTNVVSANAASPRGPGSATFQPDVCAPGVVVASRAAGGAVSLTTVLPPPRTLLSIFPPFRKLGQNMTVFPTQRLAQTRIASVQPGLRIGSPATTRGSAHGRPDREVPA